MVGKWNRSIRQKRVSRLAIRKTTLDLIILDEKLAISDSVDITVPCLVASVENQQLIIDGWHRLFKAQQLGYEWIYAFRLTETESRKVRVR